jgi:hypothetical protein
LGRLRDCLDNAVSVATRQGLSQRWLAGDRLGDSEGALLVLLVQAVGHRPRIVTKPDTEGQDEYDQLPGKDLRR